MSRRIRVAYVSPDDVLQLFLYAGTGFPVATGPGAVNQLQRLRLDGVPPGATVDHAFYACERGAWGLVIAHPSFDHVALGEVPPTVAVEVVSFLTDEAGRPLNTLSTWRDRAPLC